MTCPTQMVERGYWAWNPFFVSSSNSFCKVCCKDTIKPQNPRPPASLLALPSLLSCEPRPLQVARSLPGSLGPPKRNQCQSAAGTAGSFSLRLSAAVTRQQRLASSVTAPIHATLCVALPGAVTSSLANSPRRGSSSWIIGDGRHEKLKSEDAESTRKGR